MSGECAKCVEMKSQVRSHARRIRNLRAENLRPSTQIHKYLPARIRERQAEAAAERERPFTAPPEESG